MVRGHVRSNIKSQPAYGIARAPPAARLTREVAGWTIGPGRLVAPSRYRRTTCGCSELPAPSAMILPGKYLSASFPPWGPYPRCTPPQCLRITRQPCSHVCLPRLALTHYVPHVILHMSPKLFIVTRPCKQHGHRRDPTMVQYEYGSTPTSPISEIMSHTSFRWIVT